MTTWRTVRWRHSTVAVVLAALLTIAGLTGACSRADQEPGGDPSVSISTDGSRVPAGGEYNEADGQFLAAILPHHDQAISMTDILLSKPDVDGSVRSAARAIRSSHRKDFRTMEALVDSWGNPELSPADTSGHHSLANGTLSEDAMRQLDSASGGRVEVLFLEGMIKHHDGALALTGIELAHGKDPRALDLARRVRSEEEQQRDALLRLSRRL